MVSDHLELTIERLRYSLGGDRPSQTTHLTLSYKYKLDIKETKDGFSTFHSTEADATASKCPIYPTQREIDISAKM